MSTFLARRTAFTLVVALGSSNCSSVPRPPPIVRPTERAAVTHLADLHLPQGTDSVVQTVRGESVRGKLIDVTGDRIELDVWDSNALETRRRSIYHSDVQLVARVVKLSKGARGRLGAAIAALVTLPLGISMVGDMMIPAAIVGALIGRATGDSRAEVVFERSAVKALGYLGDTEPVRSPSAIARQHAADLEQ